MAFHWCEYFGGYTSTYCTTWTPSDWNSSTTKPLSDFVIGDSPVAQVTSSMLPITWQITSNLKLILDNHNDMMRYTFYDASNNIIYQDEDWIGTDFNRYVIGFCVDDTRREGIIRFGQYRRGTTTVDTVPRPSTEAMAQRLYSYFSEAEQPPVLYTWQSVPSISGKNGILSLVTLDSESINDGEPVSGAAVSVFDQNPVSGNNVKDIVDGNTPLIPSAVDVTAAFIISNPPVGELASRILAAKKDSIPESIEDADKTISIPANASNVTMPGLDENSQYYFAIFVADAVGDTAVSDPKDIYTSGDDGWSFAYTGEIQTFTAPQTGIYQPETWGAQGGDATDGTLTARGGYGAYAVGEVFLTQGDTLYINVGGQDGYGGGGASLEWVTLEDLIKTSDMTHYKSSNTWSWGDLDQYFNTDWNLALLPQSQSRLLTKSGEEYVYAYKDDTSYYAFCLSQIRRIKGLKFDCSIRYSRYSPYAIGMIDCLKSSSDNLTDVGLLGIVYNSSAGTYDYNVTDTNYHTYEKIFTNSVEVDYINLIGVTGEIKFKNIMFLIET